MKQVQTLSIQPGPLGPVAQYAVRELRHFLEKYSCLEIVEHPRAERQICLAVDDRMSPCSSRIRGEAADDGIPIITITGADESSLLNGVYRLLGKMGIRFCLDGDSLPGRLDLCAADNLDETFHPFCRNRGIRQHINFPMDISSYSLRDAQEYIRNLARIGMNAVTFHSYTGQWHRYSGQGKDILAGNFFYGQRHLVPQEPHIREQIQNRTYFCIPEAEPILEDPLKRSKFAQEWLRQVMNTAKQAGMRITLSLELPDAPVEPLIQMIRNALTDYPNTDVLEWISPEGGGDSYPLTQPQAVQLIQKLFGHIDGAEQICRQIPQNPPMALAGTLYSLHRALLLYQNRAKIFAGIRELPIQIGLYVTCLETLKILKPLMDRVLPSQVSRSFLPAHGATAVSNAIQSMNFSKADLQNTMLYSWGEFDGNLYLLQNGCNGIESLINLTHQISMGESIHGICLNHWRTAENIPCLMYAAQALDTPVSPRAFYLREADRLGVGDPQLFAHAMGALGELDIHNRDALFNIGFCFLGCWLNPKGLGWIRSWEPREIDNAIAAYETIQASLCRCLSGSPTASIRGIGLLRLLINRAQCSIVHLKAIGQLKKICPIAQDESPLVLDAEQRQPIIKSCGRALEYAKQYIRLHLRQMPDRGCQGTLVSYCATIPVYIDHILQYFVYGETQCEHRPASFEDPPPPQTANPAF